MSGFIRGARRRILLATIAAGAVAAPAAVQAAEEATVEMIVVTANKRSENLQSVPVAVAAVTAEMAGKVGVGNGQTLMQLIPGLQLNRQTNGLTPFLRGVGSTNIQAGAEPAVALYIDDVYYSSSSASLTNYNSIERIEVLKGPQGTLFGRNATGGIIQVFTKDPSFEASGDASAGYASHKTVDGSLYVTGPISESLAANLAVYGTRNYGGYGRNFTTGNRTYTEHNIGGRAKLLWQPSDETSARLNVDFDEFMTSQGMYFRPAPGTISNGGASSIPPPGIYDTFENLDPYVRVTQGGVSLKASHDFEALRVVSISSFRKSRALQKFAQNGANIASLNATLIYRTETYTQEIQFLSPDTNRFVWTAGAYFLHDTSQVAPFYFEGLAAGGGSARKGAQSEQVTDSYSAFAQVKTEVLPQTNLTIGARYTIDKRSLTGGRVNQPSGGAPIFVRAANSGVKAKWSEPSWRIALDHQLTDDMMVYAAYNRGFKSGLFNTIIGPDFVNATPAVPVIDVPVNPEKLDAFTAGFKSEWLDNRLRINAEAFYYKYKNLQLSQVLPIAGGGSTTRIGNAAAATMKGIDVDITATPTRNLTLKAGFQMMKGRYDDYPDGQFFVYRPATGGNCAFTLFNASNCAITPPNYNPATGHWNLKGNKTVQTPDFSMTLLANYDIPTSVGVFALAGSLFHSSSFYANPDNGQGQIAPSSPANNRQSAYEIINASVTWTSLDETKSARLWVKNLTDTYYWTYGNETTTITRIPPSPPRTYGVTVSARF